LNIDAPAPQAPAFSYLQFCHEIFREPVREL